MKYKVLLFTKIILKALQFFLVIRAREIQLVYICLKKKLGQEGYPKNAISKDINTFFVYILIEIFLEPFLGNFMRSKTSDKLSVNINHI